MGIADGLNEKTNNFLPSLRLGSYRVRIENMTQGVTQVAEDPCLRTHVTVVESKGDGANPVGELAEIFVKKDKYNEYKKIIANMVAATLNQMGITVTGDLVNKLTASDQPLKGEEVYVTVTQKRDKAGNPKTFASGDPIPKYDFRSVVPASITATAQAAKANATTKAAQTSK